MNANSTTRTCGATAQRKPEQIDALAPRPASPEERDAWIKRLQERLARSTGPVVRTPE
jgi:hypothetical protein